MIEPFDDIYYMKKAIDEAKIAYEKNEIPIGAIVVVNHKIIAKAHNLTEILQDVTAHAEMQAITSAANYIGGKYLNECSMYVTIEPCPMCAGALYWSQIGKVIYGARDFQRGYIQMKSTLHPKTIVKGGVLADECSSLLKKFFIEKRSFNKS